MTCAHYIFSVHQDCKLNLFFKKVVLQIYTSSSKKTVPSGTSPFEFFGTTPKKGAAFPTDKKIDQMKRGHVVISRYKSTSALCIKMHNLGYHLNAKYKHTSPPSPAHIQQTELHG